MQKLSFIAIFLILTLSLTACGKTIVIDDDTADDADVDSALDNSITDDSDAGPSDFEEPGVDIPVDASDDSAVDSQETSTAADEIISESDEPDVDNQDDDQIIEAPTKNIIVETPAPNETLKSPFEVTGQARVFENVLLVRVRNQDNKIVIPEQVVTARAPDMGEFGPFKIKINYQFYTTKSGTIEVFSQSPKDGSEINMVEIPVKFD